MESESKWDAAIRWAIESRQFVAFTYNGVRRLAEPHIYGTKAGKRQILTWQIGGQSLSGGLPNWRRYDLDKVSDLRVIDEPFQSRRSAPVGSRDGFDFVFAAVEPIAPPDVTDTEPCDADAATSDPSRAESSETHRAASDAEPGLAIEPSEIRRAADPGPAA